MCGFFITNLMEYDTTEVNHYIKFRGPDSTDTLTRDGVTFVHSLLSMTGEVTHQPFVDEDIICVFNGEIYNYKSFGSFDSDGECLIPLYKEYGPSFVKKLDGEFSICLFDFANSKIIISTDVFRTKPLWLAVNGQKFGVASYESALTRLHCKNIKKVEPNHFFVYDFQYNLLSKEALFKFDLNQFKNKFDDWTDAFQNSIKKRYCDSTQKVFIGLSSGYDSGAIACELNNQKVDYYAYSTIGRENIKVLKERHKLLQNDSKGFIFDATEDDYTRAREVIEQSVEDFKYEIYTSSSEYNEFELSVRNDHGSNGLSFVCSKAKQDQRKIYLSGQGADEIFADYGFGGIKKAQHSNFGGLFPEDLGDIFPWPSFFGSSQLSYLMKEEHISGAYGLEGRYPYLDKFVVQEFLWLSSKLKNSQYKSVLYNYLKENNYPFEKDVKVGFKLTKSKVSYKQFLKRNVPGLNFLINKLRT
jgi:asparagine synthetase B (glutamine-hydrolysing)